MAISKVLKWLVAPKPVQTKQKASHVSGEYGRKSADRSWYKVDETFPVKCSGEPNYDIVGESHYQPTIQRIVGGQYDLGVYWNLVAQLCFVEDNPHDPNAVGVFIDSEIVGYIPSSDAARVRREIKAANPDLLPVICKAMILGGFMDGIERAPYGIKIGLRFPIEEQQQPRKSQKP